MQQKSYPVHFTGLGPKAVLRATMQHDESCSHMSELHALRLTYRVCRWKEPSSMPKSFQPLNLTGAMSSTHSRQRGVHEAAGHPNNCKRHSYATLEALLQTGD